MEPGQIIQETLALAPRIQSDMDAALTPVAQTNAIRGVLAQAAMGNPTNAAGLDNWTYNRLARPQVNQMTNQLIVQGLSSALEEDLRRRMFQAEENYNRAQREQNARDRAAAAASSSSTTPSSIGWEELINDISNGNQSTTATSQSAPSTRQQGVIRQLRNSVGPTLMLSPDPAVVRANPQLSIPSRIIRLNRG